jgi:hypothetical protein
MGQLDWGSGLCAMSRCQRNSDARTKEEKMETIRSWWPPPMTCLADQTLARPRDGVDPTATHPEDARSVIPRGNTIVFHFKSSKVNYSLHLIKVM